MASSIQKHAKETVDYIYQRLRTQITNMGSLTAARAHVFFDFGASVCLIYF
jgi:hypothetical protein